MSDGVSLISAAHPRSAWYRRLWFWLRRPTLSEDSLETICINIKRETRMKPSEIAQKLSDIVDSLEGLDDAVETHDISTVSLAAAAEMMSDEATRFVGEVEDKDNEEDDEEDEDEDEEDEEDKTDPKD
jgi:hypothetical protein